MNTVLEFSGGKDSLACLYLLKDKWPEMIVLWLNTGAALPEVVEFMGGIRELVPHFVEVQSKQTIEERGWPADVVPTSKTLLGQLATGKWPKDSPTPLFQSRFDCCAATIWQPMNIAIRKLGARVVIRGQKLCDALRSPIVDGQVVDGVEYRFPIAHWTDVDVERYLTVQGVSTINGSFAANSSLDCWNCTAYLQESGPKLKYMRERHIAKHRQVMAVLSSLGSAVQADNTILRTTLAECL